MYLFGGNAPRDSREDDPTQDDIYADKLNYLNLRNMSWQTSRTRGDTVMLRDEHTGVIDQESGQMIIFGGFQQGNRTNQTAVYSFPTNMWENVEIAPGQPVPSPRSGHSASIYNGNMYVFGGKDDNSEKLNDLWVYNLADKRWVEIEAEGEIPFERSGHTSDIYEDFLVIFGGIWDVTKELNDMHLYSFNENRWITVQSTVGSPTIGRSPQRAVTGLNQGLTMTGMARGDSP